MLAPAAHPFSRFLLFNLRPTGHFQTERQPDSALSAAGCIFRMTIAGPGLGLCKCQWLVWPNQRRQTGTRAVRLLLSVRTLSTSRIFDALPNRFHSLAYRRCRDMQFVWAHRACVGSALVQWRGLDAQAEIAEARLGQGLEAVLGDAGRSRRQCDRSAPKPDGDPQVRQ